MAAVTRTLFAGLLAAATLLITGAAQAPAPVDGARLLDETPAPTLDAYRLFTDVGGLIVQRVGHGDHTLRVALLDRQQANVLEESLV